jgi:hypothetical protein
VPRGRGSGKAVDFGDTEEAFPPFSAFFFFIELKINTFALPSPLIRHPLIRHLDGEKEIRYYINLRGKKPWS